PATREASPSDLPPNYLSTASRAFVRTVHKTAKQSKRPLVCKVPATLCDILQAFSRRFATDVIIPRSRNRQAPMGTQQYVKFVNRLLQTQNVSTQMLRKVFVSAELDRQPHPSAERQRELAAILGHNILTQQAIY